MRIRLSMLCLLAATTAACADADFYSGHWPGNNASGSNFANLPNNHSISEQALNALGTPLGSGVQLPAIELVYVRTDVHIFEFNSLQDAIDFAQPGNSLELRYGPYLGPYTIDDKHGIAIYGTTGLHQRRIDGRGEDRGLVITNSSNITIENLHFSNCAVDHGVPGRGPLEGAALFVQRTDSLRVGNCTFSSNLVTGGFGGAVQVLLCDRPSFADCVFRDNFSSRDGGAMRVQRTTDLHLDDCAFFGNTALGSGGSLKFTGALDETNSRYDYRLTDCVFVDNSASSGGAISIESPTNEAYGLWLADCMLVGNRAVGLPGKGGALDLYDVVSVLAERCTFAQQRAGRGAVIHLADDAYANLRGCASVGNRTSQGYNYMEGADDSYLLSGNPRMDCHNDVLWDGSVVGPDASHGASVVRTVLDHCGYTADLTLDGEVNMHDLMALLHQWGPAWRQRADIANTPGGPLDRVDATDLVAMLEAWGEQAPPPLD